MAALWVLHQGTALPTGLKAPSKELIYSPIGRCCAFKRPSEVQPPVSTPEEKTLQSMLETGIRGSIAMAAAYTLHLNLFASIHADVPSMLHGIQLATPCLALETAMLLLSNTLSTAAVGLRSSKGSVSLTVMQETVDAIYLHNIRYSLIGAAPAVQRLLLEAAAQLSDDLLARGVLLGCSAAWLSARLIEADICNEPVLMATATEDVPLICSSGVQWLAAAAICCLIGTRYASHWQTRSSILGSRHKAAAAEAAAKQKLLRYEPKAVQDAAAAAAAEAQSSAVITSQDDDGAELVAQLLHGWLGIRFLVGQGTLLAAFITTGDLMASFAAGMVMQLMSSWCCEQYLYTLKRD